MMTDAQYILWQRAEVLQCWDTSSFGISFYSNVLRAFDRYGQVSESQAKVINRAWNERGRTSLKATVRDDARIARALDARKAAS